MMEDIQQLLLAGDSFTAVERIQQVGAPLEIAATFHLVTKDLYWKSHDLSATIVIGRAGVSYCLCRSYDPGQSPESIEKFRSIAKAISYDLGSFIWPGWQEPGIDPTSAELAFGMDCARLNLRLAIELKKPADRVSMAHWLVGAHALAAGDYRLAEVQFQLAWDVLPATDPAARNLQPLNYGYLAIARLGLASDDAVAKDQLNKIIAQFTARGDDDSKAYLNQLLAARQLFVH